MPSNKSEDAKKKSAERLRKQKERESKKFTSKSNVHNGASRSQSGQPRR